MISSMISTVIYPVGWHYPSGGKGAEVDTLPTLCMSLKQLGTGC